MKEEFIVELDKLRFTQDYVKRTTVEAKKMIEHLMLTQGIEWRDHISSLKGVDSIVLEEMRKINLELPIIVKKSVKDDIYIVSNGVHTAYAYWERGRKVIRAELDINKSLGNEKLYTFQELRVEDK